jgi:type I restriction enzyme S subunit
MQVKPLTADEILKNIVDIIKTHLPECKVYFFGSRIGNNFREFSDFDVAVSCRGKIPAGIFFKIVDEINELHTLKKIDLVDFYNLDKEFKQIVLNKGRIIYDGSITIPA